MSNVTVNRAELEAGIKKALYVGFGVGVIVGFIATYVGFVLL